MVEFDNVSILDRDDSYKKSHWKLYPKGAEVVHSYLESRGGKYQDVVPFGWQYMALRYLEGAVLTQVDIDEAEHDVSIHMQPGVFNKSGWQYILDNHKGKLPIRIKAIPEGRVVSQSQVLSTIENTDPNVPWLTNDLETLWLQNWYSISVASQQWAKRKMMLDFLERTGSPETIDFKWVDFGYRGVSSQESAAIGGAAHLLSFKTTDTYIALKLIKKYYQGGIEGFSIPASEHSTITSWGHEHEVDAYRNMLEAYPTGLIACVSDSYDIFKACETIWGSELKEQVLSREGTLLIRPDSGDPQAVVTRILDLLGDSFGYTTNDKGYKVLHPKVKVIQGDGINYESAYELLRAVERKGWSIDNLTLGEGSGNLQQVNRDTLKMAIKCSAIRVNGKWQDVYKDPITDPGKSSKRGRLGLCFYNGRYHTMREEELWGNNLLETIFENGEVKRKQTWKEIRKNLLGE